MAESLKTRLMRHGFNLFPAYAGTGAKVTYIASDWRELSIELPLSLRTRNYVGTIFGGSIYGAVDPFYMIMLIKNLGPKYIVWDKAAQIRFRRPGTQTLTATFRIDAAELEAIHLELESAKSVDRKYQVDLLAPDGSICASVEKTLYIRKKDVREKGKS